MLEYVLEYSSGCTMRSEDRGQGMIAMHAMCGAKVSRCCPGSEKNCALFVGKNVIQHLVVDHIFGIL